MTDDTVLENAPTVVPAGRIVDFVSQKLRRDNPEEYVRQEFARTLANEYGYPVNQMDTEVPIKIGSSRRAIDIAVYRDGITKKADKRPDNVHIVVETKRPDIRPGDQTEGVAQLQSYLSALLNATYGVWTNGIDKVCFQVVVRDGRREFVEIVDIPRYGQTTADVGHLRRDQLRAAVNLRFVFARCHDYIHVNSGLHKDEAFFELLKIIFCKTHDERTADAECRFRVTEEEASSVSGRQRAKARLDDLFREVTAEYGHIFNPNDRIELEPRTVAYVMSQLQNVSLLDTNVDVKGDAYEVIVGSNLRGDRGEFFTPRDVVRMAVEMLDPEEGEVVLDPACGSGGFLTVVLNKVYAYINQISHGLSEREVVRRRIRYAERHILGLDLNPTLARTARMNMVLNDDGQSGIFGAVNSLDLPHRWPEEVQERVKLGTVDVIATNPPFGSRLPVDAPEVLAQYDLAHRWKKNEDGSWEMTEALQRRVAPEILFIERCLQFLKDGGRAAIVVPDGVLGSPGMEYISQWILQQAKVLGTVDLPVETFLPSTGTQTSVLFLQKKTEAERNYELLSGNRVTYGCYVAVAKRIGRDRRGNPVYLRDEQGQEVLNPATGEKMLDNDLPTIAAEFLSMRAQERQLGEESSYERA
jgi:type I restriction enzyme M protein